MMKVLHSIKQHCLIAKVLIRGGCRQGRCGNLEYIEQEAGGSNPPAHSCAPLLADYIVISRASFLLENIQALGNVSCLSSKT